MPLGALTRNVFERQLGWAQHRFADTWDALLDSWRWFGRFDPGLAGTCDSGLASKVLDGSEIVYVARYARGQQHLWHLHPDLHPQESLFTSPVAPTILSDARGFVTNIYTLSTEYAVDKGDLSRTVEEFSFPGIASAVPRYFNASSFRQEWLERRNRLIPMWRCPVLLMQGKDDPMQPREFYTDPDVLAQLPPEAHCTYSTLDISGPSKRRRRRAGCCASSSPSSSSPTVDHA